MSNIIEQSAAEVAQLREQLHACIAASKDMHAAQAETIAALTKELDELRAAHELLRASEK